MGARPNIPGPGRTVIALFGLVIAPHRRFFNLSHILYIAPGSVHHQTADKTRHILIHSFGFTTTLILVGLVNCGCHESVA